jgi:hypothetical protein
MTSLPVDAQAPEGRLLETPLSRWEPDPEPWLDQRKVTS